MSMKVSKEKNEQNIPHNKIIKVKLLKTFKSKKEKIIIDSTKSNVNTFRNRNFLHQRNNKWNIINDMLINQKNPENPIKKIDIFRSSQISSRYAPERKILFRSPPIERVDKSIIKDISRNIANISTFDNSKPIHNNKRVNISNIRNLNHKNKINTSDKEVIVSIRLKLNPINNKKRLNINQGGLYSTGGYFNSFSQTEKNGFKYALNNYDRFAYNYLSMRKTIGAFDAQNIKQLNRAMGHNPNNKAKNRNQIINILDEDEEYQPNYSKYFLPSPGYGLLVQ